MHKSIKKTLRQLLLKLFKKAPIKKNKILFISHLGKGFGCNPRYLCEFLNDFHFKEFKLLWVYDTASGKPKDIPIGIKLIKLQSLQYLYEIATAKFIVANTRLPEWFNFEKRENQKYIQTWHSSLRLKKIEGDANLDKNYLETAKKDSKKIDIILSGCKFSSNLYRNSFWYSGKILESGTPRIDYLLKNRDIEKIYKKSLLSSQYKYILYAPTFRKNGNIQAYNIDFETLCETLKRKNGYNWKILYRLHPNIRNTIHERQLPSLCINMSNYNDIQELLCISDILITDYSSCMFDMAFLKKICIIYASDLDQYLKNERELYFDIKVLPFPFATNNEELIHHIWNFEKNLYLSKINDFLKKIGSFEEGTACKQIYRYISEQKRQHEKKHQRHKK